MGANDLNALRTLVRLLDAAIEGSPTVYDPVRIARNMAHEIDRRETNRQRRTKRLAVA
ncbi:hypothetical protein ACFYTG_37470 [Streptomyces mirabilis]|uniref:hypothetical protein n=1 Tax=Streptomyces mirabilis TaxID=68239 RepID=UPI0036C42212